ncbi:MAG TPA: hypothetical protein VIQ30_01050 [Pseudonocardia sp.]
MTTPANQPAAYRALLNATDGIVRQVVELHRPNELEDCLGCPEGENPDYWVVWPCRTVLLIAEQVRVSLRESDYTVEAG